MQTRKHSLEDPPVTPSSSALSNLDVSSIIEPSMLHLPTPESYSSSVSSPTASHYSPPAKKQRTRRNAKTEEEKAERAEERALRNRKAAQDSRDRRKRQHEVLEKENLRLHKENETLKQRLDILEGRIIGMEGSQVMDGNSEVTDGEVGSDFVQTHYPAVVMSYDLLCHTISLPSPPRKPRTSLPSISLRSSRRPIMPTFSSNVSQTSTSFSMASPRKFYSTNLCNFPISQRVTYSSWIMQSGKLLFESRATFDSLNTGSLEIGAKMKMEASFGRVSLSDKGAIAIRGDLYRFALEFLSLGLLVGNEGGCTGDGIINRWNTLIVDIILLIHVLEFKPHSPSFSS
jgi:hypothetical protein